MSDSVFVSDLSESEVTKILAASGVIRRLGDPIGVDARVTLLGDNMYKITGARGEFVLRFPRDEAHLSMLKKEEKSEGIRKSTGFHPDG